MGVLHKRYYRLVATAFSAFFIFSWIFVQTEIGFFLLFGVGIGLLCGVFMMLIRCPNCGKSIIMPDGSIFNRLTPEKKCSRCGYDLTK